MGLRGATGMASGTNGETIIISPIQLILFGSPGTGKSHRVESHYKEQLKLKVTENVQEAHVIKTVFHPEYTYGDFMGKLMPLTDESGKVTYRYYPGHFMKALSFALKYQHEAEPDISAKNVLLVIDEINRGNTAAIFGTAFQLLDRDINGWSSYEVDISDMEKEALLKQMGAIKSTTTENHQSNTTWKLGNKQLADTTHPFLSGKIRIPPNMSIIGTMNTSDESIYYMDSAFKRRWSWEYVPVKFNEEELKDTVIIEGTEKKWCEFVDKLNTFILDNQKFIRKVEDKQIGYRFIKAKEDVILKNDVKNKLMFFLWDTVFSRDKTPLQALMSDKNFKLSTFGQFSEQVDSFISSIASHK